MDNVIQLPARIKPSAEEVAEAIRKHRGVMTRAAKELGVPRSTLRSYLSEYGLRRDVRVAESSVPFDGIVKVGDNGDFECKIGVFVKKVGNKLDVRTILETVK